MCRNIEILIGAVKDDGLIDYIVAIKNVSPYRVPIRPAQGLVTAPVPNMSILRELFDVTEVKGQ